MQVDNLYEVSDPIFEEKKKKIIISLLTVDLACCTRLV